MKYFRYILYLYVFIYVSSANAGSHEDFFSAIRLDNAAFLRSVLAQGFDPNTVDSDGQYGLIKALRESSPGVAAVLIAQPTTQIDVRNAQDESPLMLAALRGYRDLCDALIARGAAINKPGWTPLHYAATSGDEAIVALLLQHGAAIDAEAPNGNTPLMMGAKYGSSAVVQRLLDAGADVQRRSKAGLNALDFALQGEHPDAIRMLRAVLKPTQ